MKRFLAMLAVVAASVSAFADYADILNELQRKHMESECRVAPRLGYLFKNHCVGAANVIGVTNRVYTGSAITFDPVVKLGSATLVKSTDYTQSFTNNTSVGKASVKFTAARTGLFGSLTKTFEITPRPISDATVSNITTQVYTGSPVKPMPVVVFNGSTLSTNTDYSVSWENNVAASSNAVVVIHGKGNFGGEYRKTFVIED